MGKTLGHKLALLLAERREGQSDLAQGIGVNQASVSRWMNDRQRPSVDDALRIARYFAVPLDWLADPEQDYPPPTPVPARPLGAINLPTGPSKEPNRDDQPVRSPAQTPTRKRRQS